MVGTLALSMTIVNLLGIAAAPELTHNTIYLVTEQTATKDVYSFLIKLGFSLSSLFPQCYCKSVASVGDLCPFNSICTVHGLYFHHFTTVILPH